METDMLVEEVVRDVTSVQLLQEQHNQLKAEIDAREDNFSSAVETGQEMIKNGHFASQEVRETKLQHFYRVNCGVKVYKFKRYCLVFSRSHLVS